MRSWVIGLASFFCIGSLSAQEKWEASKDSLWKGQSGTFYKVDPGCNLLMSADGVMWSPCAEKMWQDKNGSWYKLENGSLAMSTDRSVWNSAERWTDTDGNCFKFGSGGCGLLALKAGEDGAAPAPEKKVSPFYKEKREYKLKMSKKVRQIDQEIASYRNNHGRVRRKYKPTVFQLEQKKNDLRSKMREISKKSDEEWVEFKKDIEQLLGEESKNISLR
jgi:hypothetical protein